MSVFTAEGALFAQNALDRTTPLQEAARGAVPTAQPQNIRLEFEPVIDFRAADEPSEAIPVSAIVIDGLSVLSPAQFADLIEAFAGRDLTTADLTSLTNRLAARAHERGYVFAEARIAQQALHAGVLRVQLDEGRIDQIRITGFDHPVLHAQLASLANGKPVLLAELQRQILLASDLAGVTILSSRLLREGNARVLHIEAARKRIAGGVFAANDGIQPVGPVRARIDLDVNGLISPRDQIELSFSATPLDPRELIFGTGRYTVVIDNSGTKLGVFGAYSRTRPGAYLADQQITGTFWQGGMQLRRPLLRGPRRSLWLDGNLDVQDLAQDSFGLMARQDRIVAARLGLYGYGDLAGGLFQGQVTLAQGLDILGATVMDDPFASRPGAAPDFTKLSWWLNWNRDVARRVSIALSATGQFASGPLLVGESFVLGGTSFLRGYDFAQRIGDQGIIGQGEVRYDLASLIARNQKRLQLYAFADAGMVSSRADAVPEATLASSGGGLRGDLTRQLDFDFEVAVPLTEARFDTADKSPRILMRLRQAF